MTRLRVLSIASCARYGLVVGSLLAGMTLLGADAQAQVRSSTSNSAAASITGSTISTGIQIQNLSSTATANVTVLYYNPDGTPANPPSQSFTIGANSSYTLFGSTLALPAGFNGSAVVESDQPVSAIGNLLGSNPTIGEAYDGVASPTTTAYIPLFQQGNGNPPFNSSLVIQNTSSSSQTITVNFNAGSAGTSVSKQYSLPGNGSLTLDNSNDGISGRFVGSVVVTGTAPIATVINQSNGSDLLSATGSSSGTATVYAPLLMNNNGSYYTGLQVQNIGGQATNATLTVYYPDGTSQQIGTVPIAPQASYTWYPIPMTQKVGSGVVKSDNGQPLLGVVNELNASANQASAYNTFGSGTQTVNLPLVMYDNGSYFTGEQIQNIGSCSTTVTVTMSNQSGQSAPTSYNVPANSSVTLFGTNLLPGGAKVGSATASSSQACAPIVAIVNEISSNANGADTTFSYEGFNQ